MNPHTGQEIVETSPAGLDAEIFAPWVDINDVPYSDFPRSLRINFSIDSGTLTWVDEFDVSLFRGLLWFDFRLN